MKIALISVGSELVCGHTRDVNAPFIASKLTGLGYKVIGQTIADDNAEELKVSLQAASDRADLIIITGGMGPTNDDITRKAIAEFCNVALVSDEKSIHHIEEQTGKTPEQMPANYLKQTMVPAGSIVIPNTSGTAQGFLKNIAQAIIVCLPGVPTEMVRMFEDWVIPYIERIPGKREKQYTRVIHTFGLSEYILDENVKRIIRPDKNLFYSTLVNNGIISLRITLCNTEETKACTKLDHIEEEICSELGEFVFSKRGETLGTVISHIFKENAITLAVAESCTGGLVSDLITNVQGSSTFFLGGIVSYSNEVKKNLLSVSKTLINDYGVISAEVAKAMAYGARKRIQADVGLAVTGIAGPSGIEEGRDQNKPVGLVYVATALNDNLECKKYQFSGPRVDIKKRAANAALNTLRLALLQNTENVN